MFPLSRVFHRFFEHLPCRNGHGCRHLDNLMNNSRNVEINGAQGKFSK